LFNNDSGKLHQYRPSSSLQQGRRLLGLPTGEHRLATPSPVAIVRQLRLLDTDSAENKKDKNAEHLCSVPPAGQVKDKRDK
jgi:hypothetical protein